MSGYPKRFTLLRDSKTGEAQSYKHKDGKLVHPEGLEPSTR